MYSAPKKCIVKPVVKLIEADTSNYNESFRAAADREAKRHVRLNIVELKAISAEA